MVCVFVEFVLRWETNLPYNEVIIKERQDASIFANKKPEQIKEEGHLQRWMQRKRYPSPMFIRLMQQQQFQKCRHKRQITKIKG